MNKLNRLHFYFGLISVLSFVFTGVYMRYNLMGIQEDDLLRRMMFRSNHIYILFASFLHLVMSFIPFSNLWRFQKVQVLASSLFVFATLGLHISFYINPITGSMQRDLTRYSVITTIIALVLSLCVQVLNKREIPKNN